MVTEGFNTIANKQKTIPVVKGIPFLGSAFKAMKDPLKFLVYLKENFDDIVKIKIAGKDYYVIQSPEATRHVLQENAKNYYKPGAAKMMKQFLGDGLATSNGEIWLKQRRIMQPAFHRKRIEGFADNIHEETYSLIQNWKKISPSLPININNEFLKLTLNNINKTMFGTDMKGKLDEVASIINSLLLSASGSVTSIIKFPLSVPTPSNVRFLKANKAFEKIIYEIIEQRKKEDNSSHSDLLDMLLHAYDDQSQAYMSVKQLRDEVSTIFMAGHETTAQTLSWVFYHLALYPEIYIKVADESSLIREDKISMEDFQKLTWSKAVIEETMRLYPPVWVMARKSFSDDSVAGYHLPAGSTVLINIYGMNQHPGYWDSPREFIPNRFQNDNKERHPFLFIPFGAGQRLCIGSALAMMVMQTVICRLTQQFEFKIPDRFRAVAEPNITLRAKGGIKLFVKTKL
jgi:cytochrome P450